MKTLRNLFTALLLLCSITASAHDFEVDGIYYKITNFATKEVAVTYKGSSCDEYYNEYTGSVVIPESVTYGDVVYSVTSICDNAFWDCNGLTSVVIGNNVTNIEYSAFSSCDNLTSVVIGDNVTTIGSSAFSGCSALTSIEIPNSVTSIGNEAFWNCSGLTSVEFHGCVTSIGENAFHNTAWYNNQPDGVVYVGKVLYKYKGTMPVNTSIAIKDGTTTICSSVFQSCIGLASVEIPNSVTSIGNNAFNGCSALANIVIPGSVTRIDDDAFNGCVSLKELRIEDGESTLSLGHGPDWAGMFRDCPLETLYLGRNLSYDNSPFRDIATLESVVISDNVTTIGSSAFSGCSALANVVIGNSVTSVGENAFFGCSALANVVIPNSVTRIDNSAFDGCLSLKDLRIEDGESTLSLGYSAPTGYVIGLFRNCPLETLYLGRNLSYDNSPFRDIVTLESIVIGDNVTSIGSSAFSGCSSLASVEIPNSVTTIGSSAFSACGALANVVIPGSVTRIDDDAFNGCVSLKELRIEDGESTLSLGHGPDWAGMFRDCPLEALYLGRNLSYDNNPFSNITTLESVVIGDSVTSIGGYAFSGCSSLASVVIGNSVTSIGENVFQNTAWYDNQPDGVVYAGKILYNYKGTMPANTSIAIEEGTTTICSGAFSGCSGLTNVVIPNSVASIGNNAFDSSNTVFEFAAEVPAVLGENVFSSNAVFAVPDEAVGAYKAAWSGCAAQIVGRGDAFVTVDVEAMDATSGIMESIGLGKMGSVAKLTVKGSINSYDVIMFRDKMSLLRELDLTDATVVASDKAFYSGSCTGDNSLGDNTFRGLSNLNLVKLPKGLNRIGAYMFQGCGNLKSIENSDVVTSIGYSAFSGCGSLEHLTLPDGLEAIEGWTFYGCGRLNKIMLPPTVKRIGEYAFYCCGALEEIRIPSSVETVGDYAFRECNNLQKVYTYTVEPTSIQEETFSTFATATLYVPSFSFSNYYWDDGWKRFLTLVEFNEPYEYFYVNNDYTLNDDTGYIEGTEGNAPDADINAGGGFIVEGEQGDDETPNQSLGDVNVGSDGEGNCGSIIGDNNLHIDDLHIKINVNGGRWYFFAFPFDIFFKDISMENGSDYVFRYYDGEERAQNGNGGWKDINENHLKAARGYIFQCSANDVLVLNIKDVKFKKEDKYNELVAHVTENLKDASWNFVGNPYLSYYDLADMDYAAPVTVWDGEKYVAIRPGDDDYHFAPYEAFFVQKPGDQESIAFYGEEQMTKNQSDKKKEKQSAARRARGINPDRQLINLVLDNGTSSDRTRIVFNEQQSLGYETACDASKFETKGVAQLYTIGRDNVHYAINERPADNGVVMLGYTAPTAGFYTIEAQRMDAEVFVKDYKTGALHNLNDGAYSFSSDAGTFNERFEILLKGTAPGTTGIDEVNGENGEVKADIYDLQGRKMQDAGKGIYIINGEKVVK